MQKRKGKVEIDGFWLFLIGIFVILPAIRFITGYEDKEGTTEVGTKTKVISIKNSVLTIDKNTSVAPLNTEVKIPIAKGKGIVIVKKVSPDRSDPEVIAIKGKYAITSFDQTGSWDVDMYDADNILIDWVKVTVY